MKMEIVQTVCMECSCCRQYMLNENADASVQAVLFGAVKYSICPLCFREVGEEDRLDSNYRRRWKRRYAELLKTANGLDE